MMREPILRGHKKRLSLGFLYGRMVMALKGGKGRRRAPFERTSDPLRTVRMPITDTLDLHTFSPTQIERLLEDYLEECRERGIDEIRIIHGKGRGLQRHRVHSFLSKSPMIQSFRDADPGGGGWGATLAVLRKPHGHMISDK